MLVDVRAKLSEKGLVLPISSKPLAAYVPAVRTGNIVFTAGQLPMVDGVIAKTGKVGADVTVEEAYELAKILRKRFPDLGIVIAAKSEDLRFYEIDTKSLPIGILVVRVSKHSDLDHLRDAIFIANSQAKVKSKNHPFTKLSDEQVKTLLLM